MRNAAASVERRANRYPDRAKFRRLQRRSRNQAHLTRPKPSHSKDADKDRLVEILKAFKRAADAKRRGIGGAPSQPLSAPTKVRTPTESPEEPSTADSAEAFHSNDADKDRVVKVLKALMKRSQGR